jgi:MFS transporter, OFA family, oxalate/formate antiporter
MRIPSEQARFPGLLARLLGPRNGPVFYGWWIVALGAVINGVGTGILYHAFSVFFLPLKHEFRVGSAAVALFYAAGRLEGGLEGPVIGYLIGKLGPRAMIVTGICMSGGGLFLLSLAPDYWSFFFIYILIVAIGYNAGFSHPLCTTMNSWFIRSRGAGISWVTASGSAGGMIFAPLLSVIIQSFGWRVGARVAGAVILTIGLPTAMALRATPESMGLRPDGDSPGLDPRPDPQRAPIFGEPDFSVKEALQTRAFWMLMGMISCRLFLTVAVNTHLVPILVWGGMSELRAAYMVSLYAFGSILSMIAMGWIGDRWSKPFMCALGLVPILLAMVGLMFSQATVLLYLFALGLAVAMGTAPLNWALIGDLFGRRSYAALRGIMGTSYGTMTFVSPIFAGWVHDVTGSYALVLLTFAVVTAGTAVSFALLPASPRTRQAERS